MKLTKDVLPLMAMGKVFKDNSAKINSLDFFSNGEFLVTSSDDESVNIYKTSTGVKFKTVFSKKYGVDLIRFSHKPETVLCASKNGWDDSLRYLSLHDNKYIRYFKGHRDQVVSLSMSPKDDSFLSASLDNTVRLWNLNVPQCQGLLRNKGRASVGFDPQGVIFSVALSGNQLKLYDLRSFDKGPFSSFVIEGPPLEWTGMKFSADGKYVLLSTTTNLILLLDAFTGERKQIYTSFSNLQNVSLEASFSPDSQFVLSGSDDGTIHIWDTLSGRELSTWHGHVGPVGVVQWHPKAMMVASACTNLAFWIPDVEDEV